MAVQCIFSDVLCVLLHAPVSDRGPELVNEQWSHYMFYIVVANLVLFLELRTDS